MPFLKNVSSDHNGSHSTLDLDKRNLARDILQRNKDIASIFFGPPNGDIYMGEPYRDQQQLPRINFADRKWYKGVIKNDQTYISSVFLSASINAPAIAVAVPVYSQELFKYPNRFKLSEWILGRDNKFEIFSRFVGGSVSKQ